MTMILSGAGTISGLTAGGLPDSTVTPAELTQKLTSGTAVTVSGTSVDFTGIPSWVKRITVMFNGVSTNGSSGVQIQAGSGSIVTTGYLSGSALVYGVNTTLVASSTTGVVWPGGGAGSFRTGASVFSNISGNTWICSLYGTYTDAASGVCGGGSIALSGTLDRIRITTVNGTDTFDAGSINIMYEG